MNQLPINHYMTLKKFKFDDQSGILVYLPDQHESSFIYSMQSFVLFLVKRGATPKFVVF